MSEQMLKLAKKLRLKAYYDTGDPEGNDDVQTAAAREGRTSALLTFAEAIDETFEVNSELTPNDLDAWRK